MVKKDYKPGDDILVYVAEDGRVREGDILRATDVSMSGRRCYLAFEKNELDHVDSEIEHNGYIYKRSHKIYPKWEWGMFAVYKGKKVFVIETLSNGQVLILKKPLFKFKKGCEIIASASDLTPIHE